MAKEYIHDCADCRRERAAQRKEDRATLHRIAAALARGDGTISPYEGDNPKTTPKSILHHAERQGDMLRDFAYQLGQIARRM